MDKSNAQVSTSIEAVQVNDKYLTKKKKIGSKKKYFKKSKENKTTQKKFKKKANKKSKIRRNILIKLREAFIFFKYDVLCKFKFIHTFIYIRKYIGIFK